MTPQERALWISPLIVDEPKSAADYRAVAAELEFRAAACPTDRAACADRSSAARWRAAARRKAWSDGRHLP